MKDGMRKEDIVFSDEQLFTVEAKFNPRNDRVLAKKSDNIPEHMKTVYCRQKLASVIVWAAVSKTWKSPLIFIKQGTKLNKNRTDKFIAYIENILIPEFQALKKHIGNENFIFQQDIAPSHTSRKTRA